MFGDSNPIYEFRGPWGIPVQIGSSIIFLFFLFVSFSHGGSALAYDLAFLAIVIGSIFLHELGHAWGSLIQGVRVSRIMIHGGGGFCERSVSATRHQQELIVAMGPLVNISLWALASLAETTAYHFGVPYNNFTWALGNIAMVNGFLAIFNMIPVQPLDGGKLFELVLARWLRPGMATYIAGAVGVVIAVLWIPMMIGAYYLLGFVLLFLPSPRANLAMMRQGQAVRSSLQTRQGG
ncbi:MAG: site-2 protease family protein [Maritimibacter sp.]